VTSIEPLPPPLKLGRIIKGSRVEELEQRGELNVSDFLARHQQGDWGDITPEMREANSAALRRGDFVFSSYILTFDRTPQLRLWIFTEGDRGVTTLVIIDRY
jgi:hypothetical protein